MPAQITQLLASIDWTALVTGGAIWELVRRLAGTAWERYSEKKKNRRKLLASEVGAARTRVQPLLAKALAYYSAPSDTGAALASEIKRDFKLFAVEWNSINQQCRRFKETELSQALLIKFRQSLTGHLDVKRDKGLPLDDPFVERMVGAVLALQDVLQSAESKLQ